MEGLLDVAHATGVLKEDVSLTPEFVNNSVVDEAGGVLIRGSGQPTVKINLTEVGAGDVEFYRWVGLRWAL